MSINRMFRKGECMIDKLINQIEVITNQGIRRFSKNTDFDYVETIQTDLNSFRMILWKDGLLKHSIHENVPVIIDYEVVKC